MKTRTLANAIVCLAILGSGALRGAENFDDALKREAADYTARLRQAGEDLNKSRERISKEKAPLLEEMRKAEDRVIELNHETSTLSTGHEEYLSEKRRLLHDIDELRRNTTYLASVVTEGLKALGDGLAPGEDKIVGTKLQDLEQAITSSTAGGGAESVQAVRYLLERTQRVVGGDIEPGRAMNADDNRVLDGSFVFAGPEVFFRPSGGGAPGTVRVREGSRQPMYFPLPQWTENDASAFFSGKKGVMVADSSGGKALRLQQNSGTIGEHIEKGGKVAYAIIVVGIIAVILIILKSIEIFRLGADSSARVSGAIAAVANGSREDAQAALKGLRPATRELLAEGLRNIDQPRAILEERLESLLMENRLKLERRLPLLAVIATASPLMGLLGTVVGMVRTFSLITVFGTGNAGKLSSGISEVLVATELGLVVAIPALVIHGFLASRAHKHIALQERHAHDFVTAVEIARVKSGAAPAVEEVGA